MDTKNCAMSKIKEMENEVRSEGYERLPNSEEDVADPVTTEDNNMFDDTNIQNIIESSSNRNKINFTLSQEQIFTVHAAHPSVVVQSNNVNDERLSNQSSSDLKKSTKPMNMKPPTPLAAVVSKTDKRKCLNIDGSSIENANDFSKMSEFSMTENEKNNLLRKFSVSAIESNRQTQINLFDFDSTIAYTPRVLDQEYKCSICNDAFIDPRVLDCLHSFCLDCLADIELDKYHKSKANDMCDMDLSCKLFSLFNIEPVPRPS